MVVEVHAPLAIPAQDGTLDVVVTLWSGFRGVDPADLEEVDRVLRQGDGCWSSMTTGGTT